MNLGAPEIALIVLAILLLFGYKKLPDASRSLGRSLRIFKGEMKGMKSDDVRTRDEAHHRAGRARPAGPGDPGLRGRGPRGRGARRAGTGPGRRQPAGDHPGRRHPLTAAVTTR